MSSHTPLFFSTPIRYLRWAARERPAYFWSCAIAGAGPAFLIVVPPIREAMGIKRRPMIPQTYPIPTTLRNKDLKGYDDE